MSTAITTATGVLLGRYTPGTPEWDAARAGLCITATEIPAVLGLSPWMSPYALWHKKAGLPVPRFTPTPEMEWGTRHEPTIAAKYADEHPELTLHETGTWRHRDREWQRATPDRIADDRLVEIKTAATDQHWGRPGTDEIPLHYRCQVLQQMDVLGYRRTDLAVLIGLSDYREYVVEYDPADAALMRDAGEDFLAGVRAGRVPDIDGSTTTYDTVRVQPDRYDPIDVDIPGPIAVAYGHAAAEHRTADAAYTQAKAQLLAALGTGRNAVHLGRRIAYRTANADGTTKSLQPAR